MALTGSHIGPGGIAAHAAWVLRLPSTFMAALGVVALSWRTGQLFGLRTGFVAGLALLTMPFYALLARQAVTDMSFVAWTLFAMLAISGALNSNADKADAGAATPGALHRWRLGHLEFGPRALLLAALLAAVGSQCSVLIGRNLHILGEVWLVRDSLRSGIALVGEFAGAHPLRETPVYYRSVLAEPAIQGVLWLGLGLETARRWRRVERPQSLWMLAFALACGGAVLSKGLAGLALPGVCLLAALALEGRLREVFADNLKLELAAATGIVVALPWFVAMHLRHGPDFLQRLLIHDHVNRLTAGVYGDRGTVSYFAEQLAYGAFPWIAFAPAALLCGMRANGRNAGQQRLLTVLTLWFLAAFTLFSLMATKFHHYIFPAVPPLAGLSAIVLTQLNGHARRSGGRVALVAIGLVLLVFVGRDLAWHRGVRPEGSEHWFMLCQHIYDRAWPDNLNYSAEMTVFTALFALLFAAMAWPSLCAWAGKAWLASTLGLALWATQVYFVEVAPHWSQRRLIARYYRVREGPQTPLVAWQMRWFGEYFYTGGHVHAFPHTENPPFRRWLRRHRGQEVYFLLERRRLRFLHILLRERPLETLSTAQEHNKYVLARTTL